MPAADEPKYCVKIKAVECEPAIKKPKVDLATVDSDDTKDDTMEADVLIKCDRHILKNADKEIIETGLELIDKHIQYSQYLIKIQFSTIGGLCSTLLQNHQMHSLSKNSLQVVYCSSRRHWIVASNMECKKGVVNIIHY